MISSSNFQSTNIQLLSNPKSAVSLAPNSIEFQPAAPGNVIYSTCVLLAGKNANLEFRVGEPVLLSSSTDEENTPEIEQVPLQIWPREGLVSGSQSQLLHVAFVPDLLRFKGSVAAVSQEDPLPALGPEPAVLSTTNKKNQLTSSSLSLGPGKKPKKQDVVLEPETVSSVKEPAVPIQTQKNQLCTFVVPIHLEPRVADSVQRQKQMKGIAKFDKLSSEQQLDCQKTVYLHVIAPCVRSIIAFSSKTAQAELDFGKVLLGDKSVHSVELKNLSETNVKISVGGLSPLGPFYCKKPSILLRPLSVGVVTLEFEPTREHKFLRTVEFAAESTKLSLKLVGEGVVPSVAIEPSSQDLFMGNLLIGEFAVKNFKVYNTSQFPIQVAVSLVKQESGTENFNGKEPPFSVSPATLRVLPQERHEVQVRFAPDRESLNFYDSVRVSVLGYPKTIDISIHGKSWANAFFPAGFDSLPKTYLEPVAFNPFLELISLLVEELRSASQLKPSKARSYLADNEKPSDAAAVAADASNEATQAHSTLGYAEFLRKALTHFGITPNSSGDIRWMTGVLFESGKSGGVNAASGLNPASIVGQGSVASGLGSIGSSLGGIASSSALNISIDEFLSIVPPQIADPFLRKHVGKVHYLTLNFPWTCSTVDGVKSWHVQVRDNFVLQFAKYGANAPSALAGGNLKSAVDGKKVPICGEFVIERFEGTFYLKSSSEFVLVESGRNTDISSGLPYIQLQPLKGTVDYGTSRPLHISVVHPLKDGWTDYGKRREQWYAQPQPVFQAPVADAGGKPNSRNRLPAETGAATKPDETKKALDSSSSGLYSGAGDQKSNSSNASLQEGAVLSPTSDDVERTLSSLLKPGLIPKPLDITLISSMPEPKLIETVYKITLKGGYQVGFPKGNLPPASNASINRTVYLKLRADPSFII